MNKELMFSSTTDEWYNPMDFFEQLDAEFHFNLDPCATEENHKCDKYFTKEINGLLEKWGGGTECSAIPHMDGVLETG
jgi:site-specific DNA-methyltransferase (adenine-specific)